MNFGLIEALERALKKPAEELNDRLDRIIDKLDNVVEALGHVQAEVQASRSPGRPAGGGKRLPSAIEILDGSKEGKK